MIEKKNNKQSIDIVENCAYVCNAIDDRKRKKEKLSKNRKGKVYLGRSKRGL